MQADRMAPSAAVEIGVTPRPVGHGPTGLRASGAASRAAALVLSPEIRWAAIALALFVGGLLLQVGGAPSLAGNAAFLACYAAGGWRPALAGLGALRRRSLDVDLLMIVAAIGAASIGQVLDGGLLIVIFATSGALEALATMRTQDSVRSLLTLAPERAALLAGDGTERAVDTAVLVVGDVIIVRPGERIGADGVVAQGASEVDQASITGEPLPLYRTVGDEVFAGTLNREGALQVRVTRQAADSVVARIVSLVEQASATKAKTQLFIERVEQRYSVGVVTTTLAVFLLPLVLGEPVKAALLRAMTFMIVASPCAVVLATMPPLLSAIANAGRHGVLVKSAVVMEMLGATTQVAFDKTGTLTQGTPRVADVETFGMPSDHLLMLAASAERPSEHPLAQAVQAAAVERHLTLADADDFVSVPGRGVTASVAGHQVHVASPSALEESTDPKARAAVDRLERAGRTAIVVVVDGAVAGVLGLADHLRPHAPETVAALTEITGRAPILLTGDNLGAATRLAQEVGIADVRAGLLPEDKVTEVGRIQEHGQRVLLVGDGVNDAPAMAAAHVGVAMGRQGSDLALETADIVIMRDELDTLPAVIDLSRRARRAVTHNLAFSCLVIVGLVTWDLIGRLPLPLGVLGHETSTVIVGLNGLRLLRQRAWCVAGSR